MAGHGLGNSLAAAQSRADELVGVVAVDLGTGRAAGRAAGLAGDGQDSAGLVSGGVAVQEFPGCPVDVIDAAAQENGLQTLAHVAGGCRRGVAGKGGTPLVGPLRAVPDERRQPVPGSGASGLPISGAVAHLARSGCLPLRAFVWLLAP